MLSRALHTCLAAWSSADRVSSEAGPVADKVGEDDPQPTSATTAHPHTRSDLGGSYSGTQFHPQGAKALCKSSSNCR
jgi:hypothetical protein